MEMQQVSKGERQIILLLRVIIVLLVLQWVDSSWTDIKRGFVAGWEAGTLDQPTKR